MCFIVAIDKALGCPKFTETVSTFVTLPRWNVTAPSVEAFLVITRRPWPYSISWAHGVVAPKASSAAPEQYRSEHD